MIEQQHLSDRSFEAHQAKQLESISMAQIRENASESCASEHYRFAQGEWQVGAYRGCGILAMTANHWLNMRLIEKLAEVQALLQNGFKEGEWYALPSASFHQTIANMLSAERFERNIIAAGLQAALPGRIHAVFSDMNAMIAKEPIRIRIAGIGIFRTAIAALGIFENEGDYKRLISFRNKFYSDPRMSALAIRLTRPFVAHITLGYFGKTLDPNQQKALADKLAALNFDFEQSSFHFLIDKAGFYNYENLSAFSRTDHDPEITI